MVRWLWVFPVLMGLSLPGLVEAHSTSYVGGTGDVAIVHVSCGLVQPTAGGVCFPPGHIQPDQNGKATVTIVDTFINPVSGCYQQDLGFTCIRFCGSIVLTSGVNWFPDRRVEIYVDGPVNGNPFTSPCGFRNSPGTTGFVTHS